MSAPNQLRLQPCTYTVYVAKDELPSCRFLQELEQLDLLGSRAGEGVVKEALIISKSVLFNPKFPSDKRMNSVGLPLPT